MVFQCWLLNTDAWVPFTEILSYLLQDGSQAPLGSSLDDPKVQAGLITAALISGFSKGGPGPAASTLPGNLLDMQISGCTSDQKLGLRSGNVYFNKPFKCFWCTPIFENHCFKYYLLVAQMVKNLPAVWETWVRFLGWEGPLEEGMATHSSILVWRIPMDRGAGRLQSMGLQRIGHD